MTKTTVLIGCGVLLVLLGGPAARGVLAQDDWRPGMPHPTDPNVIAGDRPDRWLAASGYEFINEDPNDLRVRWVPNMEHRDWPHVVSETTEGRWRPVNGYSFHNDTPGDFRVRWVPGLEHRRYENVVASKNEQRWVPAPGYRFLSREPDDYRVLWSPGKKHPDHPGVIASDDVGEWTPGPGFNWVSDEPGDFRVNWTPKEKHPERENVVAGEKTNVWVPADGYAWVTSEPNDFRVRERSATPGAPASPQATGGKDQRVALVVGNTAYQHADSIASCVKDARQMGARLEELGFDVEGAYDVTWAELDVAVDRFVAKLTRGAVGWFYFAGHGVQVDGVNYLLPVDFSATTATKVRHRSLSADYVRESMEEKGARAIVLVLDACRVHPYPKASSGPAGLAPMSVGDGTLVAFATAADTTATDRPGQGGASFTRQLLDVLRTPGLSLAEVFLETRKRVLAASNGKQDPFLTNAVAEDVHLLPRR